MSKKPAPAEGQKLRETEDSAVSSSHDLLSALRSALDRHDEWQVGKLIALHKPSHIQLWIGNGWMHFTGYEGPPCHIPFMMRLRLWKHVKRLRYSVTIKCLSDNAES